MFSKPLKNKAYLLTESLKSRAYQLVLAFRDDFALKGESSLKNCQ